MDDRPKGGPVTASAEPTLALKAPLSGPVVPIDRVPDPVFAHRLLGDGVAIDPVSALLLAPCDGVVATIHPAGHAVVLTSDLGVEVMLHVGLDTVALGGRGFVPRVAQGRRVVAGEPLLAFDADLVARSARSLVTPVVVTSRERVKAMRAASGFVTAASLPVPPPEPHEPHPPLPSSHVNVLLLPKGFLCSTRRPIRS